MSDTHFYKKLKAHNIPVTEILQETYFNNVPDDWYIIIADVKNSTAAVSEGRHNDVNLVAAGSLIAGLNIARHNNIEIPFFFGGDGGTLIVPHEILAAVLAGLNSHNINSKNNFGLEMHIGSLPVKKVLEAGCILKIARMQFKQGLNKAIVTGDGLRFAEQLIKHAAGPQNMEVTDSAELNLDGLECRWDRVKPPAEENEIVCYLIEALDANGQISVYREVLVKIDELYGSIEIRNPISLHRLKLLLSFEKIKKEMLVKYGKWKTNYVAKNFISTFIGRLYFRFNWKVNNLRGKVYLNQLINKADTLIIDGRINTIITGSMEKRILFLNYLKEKQEQGKLVFGHHISKETVMTCYIENRNEKHIHFVDGSDGGYTEAAKEFKSKLQKMGTYTQGNNYRI